MPKTAVKMKETSKRRVTSGMTKTTKRQRKKKRTGSRMNQPKTKGTGSVLPKIFSSQPPTNSVTAELSV